jgi:leader peptidase (prepilin peptidase)/N-methyltransferase
VVELLTAVLVFLIWKHYPPPLAAINTVYVCGLIVAAMIDIDHCIIPDEISVGGILFGITTSFFCPRLFETTNHLWAVKESFIGFIVGGGLLFCIAIGGSVLFQKEAMGMGDVKLLAAIGSFVGWKGVFWIVPVSSFLGSIIGALLLLRKRRFLGVRMPFGPFLAAAGILWLLGGREWMDEYLRLF